MPRDYDDRGGGGSLRNNGTSGGGGAVSGDELVVIGHAGGNPRGTIQQEVRPYLPNNGNQKGHGETAKQEGVVGVWDNFR